MFGERRWLWHVKVLRLLLGREFVFRCGWWFNAGRSCWNCWIFDARVDHDIFLFIFLLVIRCREKRLWQRWLLHLRKLAVCLVVWDGFCQRKSWRRRLNDFGWLYRWQVSVVEIWLLATFRLDARANRVDSVLNALSHLFNFRGRLSDCGVVLLLLTLP